MSSAYVLDAGILIVVEQEANVQLLEYSLREAASWTNSPR